MEVRKEFDIVVGKRISKIRTDSGLTQKELSLLLSVNTSTYKHYELGNRATPVFIIVELAEFYNVDTNYFFEDVPETNDFIQSSTKKKLKIRTKELLISREEKGKITRVNTDKIDDKYLKELEKKVQTRARLKIKKLRLENNKMQKDVASYLEISLPTYSKYEKGTLSLSVEVVNKIAEYYEVKFDDIAK